MDISELPKKRQALFDHQRNSSVFFKISTNQNTVWALAAMLDFRSAPKTKILYMTIQ
jgi:hypothetical protein